MTIDELNDRHGIGQTVQIVEGRDSLPMIRVNSELANADIYLHGAHVTHFQPRGAEPVLFLSEKSFFEAKKPIRGGVPVIFPWFGAKADDPKAPAHGYARVAGWNIESTKIQPDGSVKAVLGLRLADYAVRMIIGISEALDLTMEVQNLTDKPCQFEQALHTYLRAGDVRQVRIGGLENTPYIDKVDGFTRKIQPPTPIAITGETDRVYLPTASTCVLDDPSMNRRIRVKKEGSEATVIWNPWIEKSAKMADFGADEWPKMVCIETANVADCAVSLSAGATHQMRAKISIEK
jgi:glucose-6-phosphate 1-epimerase